MHKIKTIKVGYLLGNLNRGGAETLALDIMNSADPSEIEFVCIYRNPGVLISQFKVPLIQIHTRRLIDFRYLRQLRKMLKAHNIQILHTNQNIDAFTGWLASCFIKVKLVQTFHGHGLQYSLQNRLIRALALRTNSRNIFVSKYQFQLYKKRNVLPIPRSQILPNGIQLSKFSESMDKDIRKELNISKSTILSVSVGNFSNGRDQITICRFLNRLKNENIYFRHLFIGVQIASEPHLYEECVRFCHNNQLQNYVSFLGNREDVPAILLHSDAFIYSTVHDTFGIAVLEAMYAALPVFTNDWYVMKEITRNGRYANLYKSMDDKDLFTQFRQFTKNRTPFKAKAQQASAYVQKEYTIEKYIKELKSLYQDVIHNTC